MKEKKLDQIQPDKVWDVVVIGGGPAGMMAAGRAAERGKSVVVLEKNNLLGKKLLITGGGRCNVTNAETDTRKFLAKFKHADKFLFSAFSKWTTTDTINFFNTRNMPTKVENELRVFPVTDRAESVWDVMVEYIRKHKVTVLSKSAVNGIVAKEKDGIKSISSVNLKNGTHVRGKSFILATGGKSHPETGSTGDGFEWLRDIGHTVSDQDASLVPLAIKDAWVKKLQGVTLKKVRIKVFQSGAKQDERDGKLLFTHFGVSGPTILNLSNDVGELLKYGEVMLAIDLFPGIDAGDVDKKLVRALADESNKKIKNALHDLMPAKLVEAVIKEVGIEPETFCHSISREQRLALVKYLKAIPMKVSKLLGYDKAVIASGGVDLKEIDFKTMRSRIYPNLYVIGDLLNINRPTGGYSLQLCWTTGFVAGDSVE